MIFQEPMTSLNPVFTVGDQIVEAIRLARPGVGYDEARRRAIEALAEVRIEHPELRVDEYPHRLSGGQRQRVAIARTILKDPRILILDDATSAVDTSTEKAIREALRNLMRNRTTFVIAHRISSIASADRILVLDQGRIVQTGTHEELVAQAGTYSDVFRLQTSIEAELQADIQSTLEAQPA
jgi:ABC-type multidrug transport system fused ATPase/permease subunit